MELEWCRRWKPTFAEVNQELFTEYARYHPELQRPSPNEIHILRSKLQTLTRALESGDRTCWLRRGKVLLNLHFPELAMGDAYKALLLAEGANEEPAIMLLAQALFMANSFIECQDLIDNTAARGQSNDALRRLRVYAKMSFQREEEEKLLLAEPTTDLDDKDLQTDLEDQRCGDVINCPYPWIKSEWLRRKPEAILEANKMLEEDSRGRCKIQKSNVNVNGRDCFGIFVKGGAAAGSYLFLEPALVWSTDKPSGRCDRCGGALPNGYHVLSCCHAGPPYCCKACKEYAYKTYHRVVCGQRFKKSNVAGTCVSSTTREAEERLWLRILATVKQALDLDTSPAIHPLDLHMLNRLTATYGAMTRFSLAQDIAMPIQLLQMLGVDVFSDLRYDTWVLRTIAARLQTNLREYTFALDRHGNEVEALAINALYSFFNHSCEPNVDVRTSQFCGDATVWIFAKKAIGDGGEAFISYLDDKQLKKSYKERQKLLEDWTGGVCKCSRCERERRICRRLT